MKDKLKIASVRPSPIASIVGIVGSILVGIFGIVFILNFRTIHNEEDLFLTIFGIIFWALASIGGVIYHIKNLSTYSNSEKRSIPITAMKS